MLWSHMTRASEHSPMCWNALQQDRVCHIAAQIAHKDVKVGGGVALLFLEGPLDAQFL